MYFWEGWGSKALRKWDETGQPKPFGCVCFCECVCVTHIRYEEGKETQVGDGDRELSRLPGPAGSMGRESGPLSDCTASWGLSCCLDVKLKTQTHA